MKRKESFPVILPRSQTSNFSFHDVNKLNQQCVGWKGKRLDMMTTHQMSNEELFVSHFNPPSHGKHTAKVALNSCKRAKKSLPRRLNKLEKGSRLIKKEERQHLSRAICYLSSKIFGKTIQIISWVNSVLSLFPYCDKYSARFPPSSSFVGEEFLIERRLRCVTHMINWQLVNGN